MTRSLESFEDHIRNKELNAHLDGKPGTHKFEVYVTRELTETATVMLFARDREEAEELAFGMRWELEYEVDDNVGDTYVSDVIEY